MPAATIIFSDVVAFSRKPTAEQRRLVEALTAEVLHEIRTLLLPPSGQPEVMALPTGDGLALAFLHREGQTWNRSTILHLVLRLQRWAARMARPIRLRIGLHVGPVDLVTDINGRPNVCGDTINFAQRVMDAANPGQVLLSDTAFRTYIGPEDPVVRLEREPDVRLEFAGPFEVYAKHGMQILVYKAVLQPEEIAWSNDDPAARHMMLVGLTPLPKEIDGAFSDRLACASSVALVQLTGDRLLAALEDHKASVSATLRSLWVLMPDPEVYRAFELNSPHAAPDLVRTCATKWKDFLAKVRVDQPRADVRLLLFRQPPFFGGSFLDWDRPDGRIHVSPYVWGVAAPECPGYDLQWLGRSPSAVYEAYVKGIDYLVATTPNALAAG